MATEIAPVKSQLCVMGEEGDNRLEWDRNDRDAVEAAREMFNKLRGKRYLAFVSKGDGSRGREITEFDASVERIVMIPPVRGG